MGACVSTNEAKNLYKLQVLETNVVIESFAKGNYVDNEGFLQRDRFQIVVTFNQSKQWAEDNKEKFFLHIPMASSTIDLRPFIAYKVALINWLNDQKSLQKHFCMALQDKSFSCVPITTQRTSGRVIDKTVEIGVIIKGDEDFNKCDVKWPQLTAACKDLVAYAAPDYSTTGNTIKLIDGGVLQQPFQSRTQETGGCSPF
eukprot:TRINITY_DN145_c0_g1_i3.p1 TRINITY_DN145_c0_g1~~TRINITY_DN145_c0_g1_i3.p1  ORF type:complete len:200 (-),score=32.99 TRINITY_DN145_c0_g1_i3:196-795(-)